MDLFSMDGVTFLRRPTAKLQSGQIFIPPLSKIHKKAQKFSFAKQVNMAFLFRKISKALVSIFKILVYLYFEHLHMVSSTIILPNEKKAHRQDDRMVYGAGLGHQSLCWHGLESNSSHFVNIAIQSIVSFILNTCKCYLLPSSMLLTSKHTAGIAEWYETLV